MELTKIDDRYKIVSEKRDTFFNKQLGFIDATVLNGARIFQRRIEEGVFDESDLTECLNKYLPGYIYSTGLFMTQTRHNHQRQYKSIASRSIYEYFDKDINYIKSKKIYSNQKLMLDSAGHQIIMGYMPLKNAIEWTEVYFDYVKNNDLVDFAFSLDIHADIHTPGFKHPQILWDVNCKSCDNMLSTLTDDSLQKIIWVVQFKGQLLDLWNSLHKKYDIFKKINKFAIGGVAQGFNKQTVSYPLYMIPAALILSGIKKNLWADYYLLHILGVMAPSDFLQFGLIHQVAKHHGINLQVTNDSSNFLKANSVSASFKFFIDNKLVVIDFKSSNLEKRNPYLGISNKEAIHLIIKKLIEHYPRFKDITSEDIYLYDKSMNKYRLNKKYWGYILLLSYIFYSNLQNYSLQVSERCIEYFLKGDKFRFEQEVNNYLMVINKNKITKSLHQKQKNYWEGVELLMNLDEEKILEMNKRVFPDLEIFKHGDLNIPEEYK